MLLPLPAASCAQLGCTPSLNEGDADLSTGEISGCHAYGTLTISGVVNVAQSNSVGFAACADHILVGGALAADGARLSTRGKGPGAGGSCGTGVSGGVHGGAGADPSGCGGGGTYDDLDLPRLPGSGGGVFAGGWATGERRRRRHRAGGGSLRPDRLHLRARRQRLRRYFRRRRWRQHPHSSGAAQRRRAGRGQRRRRLRPGQRRRRRRRPRGDSPHDRRSRHCR